MADTDGFERGMGRAGRSLDSAGGKMRSIAGGGLKALGVGMLGVAGIAGGGLVAGLTMGTRSLIEHEKANAQTAAVIKSTGGAANVAAKDVTKLADSLEKKTGVDDLAIQSGANLLLTFTNVQNGAKKGDQIFTQATKTILDMSVAMGQDMSTSAIQVGKALNDPIKGMSALQRAGVTFTEKQKEAIKAMVESGNTMGAQKLILAELNKEFGGSAEAIGGTFAGQLNIAKARLEEVAEKVAARLLPVLTNALDWINSNWPAIERVFTQVFNAVAAVIESVVVPAFRFLINEVIQPAVAWIQANWPQIKSVFETVLNAVGTVIRSVIVPALKLIIDGATAVVNWIRSNWPTIKGIFETVFNAIRTAVNSVVVPAFKALVDAVQAAVSWIKQNWPGIRDTVVKVFDAIKDAGTTVVNFFKNDIPDAFNAAVTAAKNLGTNVKDAVVDGFNTVVSAVSGFAKDVAGAIKDWATGAASAAKGVGTAAVKAIGEGLKEVGAKVKTAFQAVAKAITGVASGAAKAATTLGREVIDGVVTGLSALFAKVKKALQAVADAIAGAAEAAFEWAVGIGGRIIDGVVSGLSGLYQAVKDKVESALSSALSALNPFSPVEHGGEVYIGRPIVEGAVRGLQGLGPEVKRSIEDQMTIAMAGLNVAGKLSDKLKTDTALVRAAAGKLGMDVVVGILTGTRELPEKMGERMQEALEKARDRVARAQALFQEAFGKFADAFRTAFDAVTSNVSGQMQTAMAGALAEFDKGTQSHMTATEKFIADQEAAFRRRDIEQAAADAQLRVNEAIAAGMDQGSAEFLELLEARDKAQLELTKLNSAAQIEAERKAWEEQRATERAAMEESNKQRVLDYESQRALQAEHLTARLDQLAKKLAEGEITESQYQKKVTGLIKSFLPEYGSLGALLGSGFVQAFDEKRSAASGAAQNVSDAIAKALFGSLWQTKRRGRDHMDSFVEGIDNGMKDAEQSGKRAGEAFAKGLADSSSAVGAAAAKVAAAAAANLKLSSPSKEGPLSDLDRWWTPMASTLLEGLDTRRIRYALMHLLGRRWRPPGFPGGGGGGGGGGGTPGGGGPGLPVVRPRTATQGQQVIVNVAGHVTADRDLAMVVRDQLVAYGRRNPSIFSGVGVNP